MGRFLILPMQQFYYRFSFVDIRGGSHDKWNDSLYAEGIEEGMVMVCPDKEVLILSI